MGEAFLFGSGGGDNLKRAFAIISVEYPKGSICTCTNSETGKSYKAGNTYGAWAFGVDSAGTWTVHCETGDENKEEANEDVVIAEQNQAVHVQLRFRVYLYNKGDLCNQEWRINKHNGGYLTPTGDDPFMYISSNGGGNARVANGFLINQKIDLTGFNELTIHVLDVTPITEAWLFVTEKLETSNQMYYYFSSTANAAKIIAKKEFDNPLHDDKLVTLNISELNGEYYINMGTRAASASSPSMLKVDEVFLKK